MDHSTFEWDSANIGHVADHGVSPEEAEQAIHDDPLDVGFDVVNGEERWSYIGETNSGLILRVVITIRGERIRVLTAFEPSRHLKNWYLETKAGLR